MRNYFLQIRQETGLRMVEKVFEQDDKPSKVWINFSLRDKQLKYIILNTSWMYKNSTKKKVFVFFYRIMFSNLHISPDILLFCSGGCVLPKESLWRKVSPPLECESRDLLSSNWIYLKWIMKWIKCYLVFNLYMYECVYGSLQS